MRRSRSCECASKCVYLLAYCHHDSYFAFFLPSMWFFFTSLLLPLITLQLPPRSHSYIPLSTFPLATCAPALQFPCPFLSFSWVHVKCHDMKDCSCSTWRGVLLTHRVGEIKKWEWEWVLFLAATCISQVGWIHTLQLQWRLYTWGMSEGVWMSVLTREHKRKKKS